MAEAPHPDFQAIYLDTNMLKGEGWPTPSILLNNLFRFAVWWGIRVFLPEPVLKEAYEHWLRGVKDGISGLGSATRNLERLSGPVKCEIRSEHTPIENIIEEYGKKVDEALKDYSISSIPFTKRSTEEVFGFATKYLMPFAHDGKGKGFQDAVILLSILDHLNSYTEVKAILITADKAFKEAAFMHFIPGFDSARLKIVDSLTVAYESLWEPYFDETVIKPYRQEVEAVQAAVGSINPELKKFVRLHLSRDMLKPGYGDTIQEIISVDDVRVVSIETPLPKSGESLNRTVTILIRVSADCSVHVSRDLSYVMPFYGRLYGKAPVGKLDVPPLPEELDIELTWYGGINATAEIVDGKFQNITLQSLVPDKETGK